MSTWPSESTLFNTAITGSDANPLMKAWLQTTKQLLGAVAPQTLRISNGAITPASANILVDTEGGAAADTLSVINTSSLHDGATIMLRAADSSRTVTVQHSTAQGGLATIDGQNVALDTQWPLYAGLVGGRWVEIPGALRAIKQVDSTVVHNAGNETVRGTKTFNAPILINSDTISSHSLNIINTSVNKGTIPTTNTYRTITFRDATSSINSVLGLLQNYISTNGDVTSSLKAYQNTTDGKVSQLSVVAQYDGTCYTSCPTPPANANSTEIATAEWVNDKLPSVATTIKAGIVKPDGTTITVDSSGTISVPASASGKAHVIETYKSGDSWYRVWSDGFCMQGGVVGKGIEKVYFLKTFNSLMTTGVIAHLISSGQATAHTSIPNITVNYFTLKETQYNSYHNIEFPAIWVAFGYVNV